MRTGLCLHTDYVTSSRTLEVCKKYHSLDIDDEEHDIVFVYNYGGVRFTVFESMVEAVNYAYNGSTGKVKCLYQTDLEGELDSYLSGVKS